MRCLKAHIRPWDITTSLSEVAKVSVGATFLTTTVLLRTSYRGDIAVASLGAAWVAVLAAFASSGVGLWTALATATAALITYITTVIWVAILYRLSPLHPLWAFRGPIMNKITSLKLLHSVWAGKRFMDMKELHDEYGNFVRTGPNTLSITSQDAFQPIYATAQSMDKSDAYRQGRAPHGGLFFFQSREEHNVRRRIWAAAFTGVSLDHLMKVVDKRTRQMLQVMDKRRDANGLLDMTEMIRHWSFDLMGEMTFGQSNRIEMMDEGDPDNIVESVQNGTAAFEIFGEVPSLFDLLYNLPAAKELRKLDIIASNLMEVRKNKFQGDDLASHLLGEHGGPRLSDTELNLDSTLAIAAGSDTTAGTITFMLFHILNNPTVYDKLIHELTAHFYGPEDISDFKGLQELPYLSSVVFESLRLGTPFGGMPRVVPKGGCAIAGKFVPEDTVVGIPLYAMQVSPENYYPSPMEFLPDRWQPNGLGPETKTKALMCFSFGAFSCLAKPFAIQELHLVIAKLLLAYDMRFAPSFDPQKFKEQISNMRTTIFGYPLLITAKPIM
ncbi:cytochrome P450 [Hymenopellis radicata]|nr:cytochrome P450 [Hymenopellis radicata]